MVTKLTTLTHKITIKLHLVAESCTICSSRSRLPVRKLLDTPSYVFSFYLFFIWVWKLISQSKGRILRVFVNSVMRKIFEPNRH